MLNNRRDNMQYYSLLDKRMTFSLITWAASTGSCGELVVISPPRIASWSGRDDVAICVGLDDRDGGANCGGSNLEIISARLLLLRERLVEQRRIVPCPVAALNRSVWTTVLATRRSWGDGPGVDRRHRNMLAESDSFPFIVASDVLANLRQGEHKESISEAGLDPRATLGSLKDRGKDMVGLDAAQSAWSARRNGASGA